MKAYKGFDNDLKCRGFQFHEGKTHIEPEANCVKNGFHCAEDPLDCLTYYPNWNNSVYYIVEAAGDIDEDGSDTKISCTEITLIKKLDLQEFVEESLLFMVKYPFRKWNSIIKEDTGHTNESSYGFVIVRGDNPMAAGTLGKVLGIVKQDTDGTCVIDAVTVIVDGISIKENTWYTLHEGKILEVAAK